MSRNLIGFFSDIVMLPGLHAALTSLTEGNPKLDADIFVFCENLNFRDKEHSGFLIADGKWDCSSFN
jgi:hypothetical protein